MVYRVYVEKKEGQRHEASGLLREIKDFLQIENLTSLRVLNRYDAENMEKELFDYAVNTVFSEPQVDDVSYDVPEGQIVFAVEPLPGQYDQRADSAAQCIQIISQGNRPIIRTAKVYVLEGELTDAQIAAIKKHVINAVESREASLEKPETLNALYAAPQTVATVEGFIGMGTTKEPKNLDNADLTADKGIKIRTALAMLKLKKYASMNADEFTKYFFKSEKLRTLFTGIFADFCADPNEIQGLGIVFMNFEKGYFFFSPGLTGYCYSCPSTGGIMSILIIV